MLRGEVWWTRLGSPRGSEPGFRRPTLIVSADPFNKSKIGTVVVVAITSNLARADAPGNVRLPKGAAGLPKASVANVARVMTLNREDLVERVGQLPAEKMRLIDAGLKLSLALR